MKDRETWERIIREGVGYIYNDFGTQFPGDSLTWNTPDFNKLHHAHCSQVKRMTYMTDGKLTKHFFRSRKEASDWLGRNREAQGYTRCKYCKP